MEHQNSNRNQTKREITKIIYAFYDDDNIIEQLLGISEKFSLCVPSWKIKYYLYNSENTYRQLLQRLNSPYHKYEKNFDKLCLINRNLIIIKGPKRLIEHFTNISSFNQWLNTLKYPAV